MIVIDNNEPAYIEDFRRKQPDWANDNDPNGDPDPNIDWLPAFKRASYYHLTTNPREELRFQRTYQRLVFVGRTRSQYKLSGTLHLFSLRLEGLYPRVELKFDQNTDGIHIHYPKTPPGVGTSFNLPEPVTNYGGVCTLRNLVIRGTARRDLTDVDEIRSFEGKRGVIIQMKSFLDAVEVFSFGWHGFHVTADVHRTTADSDGAIANANGTTLLNCRAHNCGYWPGTDVGRVSEANPNGHRPFGSGLRLEGGDANICYTRSFNGSSCARWAIDDVGFLGNKHDLPHTAGCFHNVTQWESDISSHPEATVAEKRDYRTYGVSENNPALFSYHIENPNARSVLTAPYVEGNRVELFQVGLEYFTDLEEMVVSPRFQNEFKRNNVSLPDSSPIEHIRTVRATATRSEYKLWRVVTFEYQSYLMQSEDKAITIYTDIVIFDVRFPSFVISGIGGKDWKKTRRIKSGQFTNSWKFTANSAYGTHDDTLISESYGNFLTLSSHGDNPTHPYRLKYVHYLNDDERNAAESDRWAGFYKLDRANSNRQLAFALTGSKSFEKTSLGIPTRQLDPGKMVMPSHYRAAGAGFTHFRKVEYGTAHDLASIESRLTASEREIGDTYICLRPIAGGVYEAVVIEDPNVLGTKIWAMISQVQI